MSRGLRVDEAVAEAVGVSLEKANEILNRLERLGFGFHRARKYREVTQPVEFAESSQPSIAVLGPITVTIRYEPPGAA
jgi:hypothetical protein